MPCLVRGKPAGHSPHIHTVGPVGRTDWPNDELSHAAKGLTQFSFGPSLGGQMLIMLFLKPHSTFLMRDIGYAAHVLHYPNMPMHKLQRKLVKSKHLVLSEYRIIIIQR